MGAEKGGWKRASVPGLRALIIRIPLFASEHEHGRDWNCSRIRQASPGMILKFQSAM